MSTAALTSTCVPRGTAPASFRHTKTSRTPCHGARAPSRGARAVVPRASGVDDALQFGTAITDYVPSPMDTSALQAQGIVLLTVGVMTAYWWYVLVPGARVNLAVNKRTGKLREYLIELKGDDSRAVERFFYQKWLAKVDPETRYLLRDEPDLFEESSEGGVANGAGAMMKPVTTTERRTTVSLSDTEGVTRDVGEESLEDIIRKAKNAPDFWSGDNPVLVALLITVGFGALVGGIHR